MRVTFFIDPALYRRLTRVCVQRGETIEAFVEKAVAARLGQIVNHNHGAGRLPRQVIEDIMARGAAASRLELDRLEAMWSMPPGPVPTMPAPAPTSAPPTRGLRRCSRCHAPGHYAPRCQQPESQGRA